LNWHLTVCETSSNSSPFKFSYHVVYNATKYTLSLYSGKIKYGLIPVSNTSAPFLYSSGQDDGIIDPALNSLVLIRWVRSILMAFMTNHL
jgi:hypothetical protein